MTTRRTRKVALLTVLVAALGAGIFLLGRLTVDTSTARDRGRNAGYSDGLQVGEAQGREEGRALQVGNEVPPTSRQPVQDGFSAGYTAGENDAFGGYDGGWALSSPYLITVETGTGKVVYRIATRLVVDPKVNYYLCADGRSICHEPRSQ